MVFLYIHFLLVIVFCMGMPYGGVFNMLNVMLDNPLKVLGLTAPAVVIGLFANRDHSSHKS